MTLLFQYSFIVVALGTMCLAMSTGIVGTISILKRQSLIGDAVGHASFPGIVLAFIIAGRKDSLTLMSGAIIAGVCAFFIIQYIVNSSKLEADTTMAVILSAMFGFGMVLKSYIQGNSSFSGSQAGLANYIFGQAAYMLKEDVIIIFSVSIVSILLFLIFFKEIKIHVFDEAYAETLGIKKNIISVLIIIITMLLIAAGLKAVGVVLISSMLITPGVIGMQWSKRYESVLIIAAISGALSALIGTSVSTLVKGMSTGPSIILCMTAIAFLSVLFGPYGIIASKMRIGKLRMRKDD
ncbi:manganese/zinc/iron transport system permease protein [[Eubacterium] yurii]|nr:manganese/zinc/iron transport system permease protein [[Eubacterium] yurii]